VNRLAARGLPPSAIAESVGALDWERIVKFGNSREPSGTYCVMVKHRGNWHGEGMVMLRKES